MRQWAILNADIFAWNVGFLEFFANLKENYFDFSYIRDWQLHIMLQRHQSWVQNESKSKSIWAEFNHGAPFILCLNGSKEKDYRSREQAATESFALVARSYSGQLDRGPCSVSRPEFVSILILQQSNSCYYCSITEMADQFNHDDPIFPQISV